MPNVVNNSETELGLFTGSSSALLIDILIENDLSDNSIKIYNEILNLLQFNSDQSLCSGNAGYLWLLNKLGKKGFLENYTIDLLSEPLIVLLESTVNDLNNYNFDYLYGATGKINVLLQLKGHKECEEVLKLFSRKVVELSMKNDSKSLLCGFNRNFENYHPNTVDLGFAHGLASILLFLMKDYQIRKKEVALSFVKNQLDYICSYYSFEKTSVGFPCKIENNIPLYVNTQGWCYGDLIYVYLYQEIHKATKELRYLRFSEMIFEDYFKNFMNRAFSYKDPFLCHGKFSTFLFLNKLSGFGEEKVVLYKKLLSYKIEGKTGGGLLEGLDGLRLLKFSIKKNDFEWSQIFCP